MLWARTSPVGDWFLVTCRRVCAAPVTTDISLKMTGTGGVHFSGVAAAAAPPALQLTAVSTVSLRWISLTRVLPPAENDVRPTGQCFSNGLMGLPSHDDGVPHGGPHEMVHVGWKVPGKLSIPADHPVPSAKDNCCKQFYSNTCNRFLFCLKLNA